MARLIGQALLVLWWLLLLFTYSFAWPRPFDDWKNLLLYAGAGIFTIVSLRRWERWTPRSELAIVGIYFLLAALSLLSPHAPTMEGWLALARLLMWIGLVWAFAQMPSTRLVTLMQWCVASTALLTLPYIYQFFVKTLPWLRIGHAFFLPIGHITYFSEALALQVPFACWLAARTRGLTRILWGLATIALLQGVWIMGGRASLAGLVMAAVVGLALLWRTRLISWRRLAAITALVVALMFLLTRVLPQSLRGQGLGLIARVGADLQRVMAGDGHRLEALFEKRWHSYRGTWLMIRERPWFGHGLGSFRFVYPEYGNRAPGTETQTNIQWWFMHPHNEVLHQAAEIGLLGVLTILVGLGWLARRVFRGLRSHHDPQAQSLLIASVACLTMALVSWQLSTSFLHPLIRWMVALPLAIIWQQTRTVAATPARTAAPWWRRGALGMSVVLTLFLLAHHVSLYAVRRTQGPMSAADRMTWGQRAEWLSPGGFDAYTAYYSSLKATGRHEEAMAVLEDLLVEFPFVHGVLFEAAQLRLVQGRMAEARVLLEHTVRNDPSFVPAQELLQRLP